MASLVEFLLARIAEDEERAGSPESDQYGGPRYWQQFARPRVLAECEAKRLIVGDLCELVVYDRDRFIVSPQVENLSARTLALLTLPYADHPDYREEWRP